MTSVGHKIHDWLDLIKKKIRKILPSYEQVANSRAYKLFGTTLFRKDLWSFKAESLARGLGLGLFVAFTPTIGFQMIIVGILILFIPGNLPIAIVACWVTNVFTAPPIYFFEYQFGKWLVELRGVAPLQQSESYPAMSGMYEIAGAMWLGSLVVSVVAGIGGYFLTLGLVNLERKLRLGKIIHLRRAKKGQLRDNHIKSGVETSVKKEPND